MIVHPGRLALARGIRKPAVLPGKPGWTGRGLSPRPSPGAAGTLLCAAPSVARGENGSGGRKCRG